MGTASRASATVQVRILRMHVGNADNCNAQVACLCLRAPGTSVTPISCRAMDLEERQCEAGG